MFFSSCSNYHSQRSKTLSHSSTSSYLSDIIQTLLSNCWFVHNRRGLHTVHPATSLITCLYIFPQPPSLKSVPVSTLRLAWLCPSQPGRLSGRADPIARQRLTESATAGPRQQLTLSNHLRTHLPHHGSLILRGSSVLTGCRRRRFIIPFHGMSYYTPSYFAPSSSSSSYSFSSSRSPPRYSTHIRLRGVSHVTIHDTIRYRYVPAYPDTRYYSNDNNYYHDCCGARSYSPAPSSRWEQDRAYRNSSPRRPSQNVWPGASRSRQPQQASNTYRSSGPARTTTTTITIMTT